MRRVGRRVPEVSIGSRSSSSAGSAFRQSIASLLVAAVACGLFGLAWIYGNGLRDARYLDGWLLVGIMGVQLHFHFSKKAGRFSPKSATRWRSIHICLGYLLIAMFISHSDFSLPDTALEWALWVGFFLVTISGIFGTYLSWSLRTMRRIDESVGYDRILMRRAELARDIRAVVSETDPAAAAIALPASPHDDWIKDFYADHLQDFFEVRQNFASHLVGSQRPLKRLTDEIDNLSRYVDRHGQKKLSAIRGLVVEKDRLDFTRAQLGLNRAWLFVHVPITYGLLVLTLLHLLVVYAFSSGLW